MHALLYLSQNAPYATYIHTYHTTPCNAMPCHIISYHTMIYGSNILHEISILTYPTRSSKNIGIIRVIISFTVHVNLAESVLAIHVCLTLPLKWRNQINNKYSFTYDDLLRSIFEGTTRAPKSLSGLHSVGMGWLLVLFFDENVKGIAYLRILNEFALPELAIKA